MNLKIGQKFVNANGVECEVISFGEGRVLYRIMGLEEGTNSNKGKLGALICEVEHPEYGKIRTKVGGGFAEFERIAFWDMKDELIGRIISVQYFEVTQNTTTNEYSLRFPEFLELKPKGQKINN